ncbi:twin-arginine translocation pathway signal protein [Paucibacter aquatile]|uniref:Twin-arginine translocation pathway signal protein n=1 Tax=Kinneretia aquatilis TaxID=2070761 RepID=A0A2N8KS07_9BURK|nr:sulfatase-like hydrolase/transferase [Paucibacter aquatile]PND36241.1 twin-arginine translocation pathway signal protein [Paucibacter aquatile]
MSDSPTHRGHWSRRDWLERSLGAAAGLGLGAGSASALAADTAKPAGAAPHIVFIMADDLGWGDLGCYGQTDFSTPVLDRMAAQGQRLTQAYANSPVCSATRTALITGRYQYRLRVGLEEPIPSRDSPHGLPPDHPTLPGQLRAAGYRTTLVGKWHLGHPPAFGPLKSGYESFYGNLGGGIDYFNHKDSTGPKAQVDFWDGERLLDTQGYYTDLLSSRAVEVIQACKTDPRPLFLSLHYTAPHWPWEGPEDAALAGQLKSLLHHDGGSLETYGRMVQAMDRGIGRVLQALREQGLEDNTLVVFTSDNGGERFSRTWPFSGQKTELLEGGIRVPLILRWPARLQAGVSEQTAISMDMLPSLLAAASAPAPALASDGIDLLPVLQGREPLQARRLFWRYKAQGQRALREGTMKYLRIRQHEFLFDLSRDPRERANLASAQADRLATMRALWEQWNAEMLPITPDVYTHWVRGDRQADRYGVNAPEAPAGKD